MEKEIVKGRITLSEISVIKNKKSAIIKSGLDLPKIQTIGSA